MDGRDQYAICSSISAHTVADISRGSMRFRDGVHCIQPVLLPMRPRHGYYHVSFDTDHHHLGDYDFYNDRTCTPQFDRVCEGVRPEIYP